MSNESISEKGKFIFSLIKKICYINNNLKVITLTYCICIYYLLL